MPIFSPEPSTETGSIEVASEAGSFAGVEVAPDGLGERLKHSFDKLAFGLRVRADFYTSMSDFADSDIAPNVSLGDMAVVAQRRFSKHSLVKVYRDMMDTLAKGHGLPAALAPWVPSQEATALSGAETAGPLVLRQIMRELGTLLTRQATARRKMWKAVGGGVVGLLVMAGVIYQVISTLVPVFKDQITPALAAKIPFTAWYFAVCGWLVNHILGITVFLVAWAVLTGYLIPTWTRGPRKFFDQYIPPFSLYQRVQATMFLSTTAAMMRSGITLKSVLEDMSNFGSKWLRFHVDNMKTILDAGGGEIAAIAAGPLPYSAADALEVYKRIPRFQDVMTRLAEANFTAYERLIEALSTTITALSMFLMTAFGGATVVAMFQFSDAMRAAAMAAQGSAG